MCIFICRFHKRVCVYLSKKMIDTFLCTFSLIWISIFASTESSHWLGFIEFFPYEYINTKRHVTLLAKTLDSSLHLRINCENAKSVYCLLWVNRTMFFRAIVTIFEILHKKKSSSINKSHQPLKWGSPNKEMPVLDSD